MIRARMESPWSCCFCVSAPYHEDSQDERARGTEEVCRDVQQGREHVDLRLLDARRVPVLALLALGELRLHRLVLPLGVQLGVVVVRVQADGVEQQAQSREA